MAIKPTDQGRDLARTIATPALMGQHLGLRLLGMPYNVYPWLQYVEQRILTTILRPGRKIIIISVPPQNGKTTYFGLLLPLWYLGMNPGHQILFISYNEEQATKWGTRVRDSMKRFGPEMFGEGVSQSTDAKSDWSMANGFGGMKSVGILQGVTGNPGHLIICDDLIKTSEDASSPAVKKKIQDEIQNSVFSRFQKNTTMIVVATRWAEDDPSGWLIDMASQDDYRGRPVEYVNIQAIAEPTHHERIELSDDELEAWTDILGRREGEALEGQFDQEFYDEVRATMMAMDSAGWYSLYQGNPTSREGGMFPVGAWRYYEPSQLPDITKRVRVWDLAASEGKGDYSVGTLMGRGSDGNFYILDRDRFRLGPAGVEQRVIDAAKRDGHETTILIEEERNGAGRTVFEAYKRKLVGYTVEKAKAEGSKESRAVPYSNEQNKGNVYLPADAPWLEEWRSEHVQMDGAGKMPRHDDQIDTGAYAFKFLTEGGDSVFWDPTMLSQTNPLADLLADEDPMELLAMQRIVAGT